MLVASRTERPSCVTSIPTSLGVPPYHEWPLTSYPTCEPLSAAVRTLPQFPHEDTTTTSSDTCTSNLPPPPHCFLLPFPFSLPIVHALSRWGAPGPVLLVLPGPGRGRAMPHRLCAFKRGTAAVPDQPERLLKFYAKCKWAKSPASRSLRMIYYSQIPQN